jgi:hypothetical protein
MMKKDTRTHGFFGSRNWAVDVAALIAQKMNALTLHIVEQEFRIV